MNGLDSIYHAALDDLRRGRVPVITLHEDVLWIDSYEITEQNAQGIFHPRKDFRTELLASLIYFSAVVGEPG